MCLFNILCLTFQLRNVNKLFLYFSFSSNRPALTASLSAFRPGQEWYLYALFCFFFFFLSLYPLYVIPFLHINRWGDIEITIHYILENVLRNAVGSGFSFSGVRRSQIATVAAVMERFVTVNRAFSWYVPESNTLRDDWTECRVKDTWFMTMKHMSIKKVKKKKSFKLQMIKFASYFFFKESHLSLCLDLNVLQRYFFST